jgi:hypothetical protein
VSDLWQSPTIQRLLWLVARGGAVVAALLIIAVLAPPLAVLFREAREALTALKDRLVRWASEVIGGRFQRFWEARRTEPLEPVLAGLKRVDAAAATLGQEQIVALRGIEQRFSEHLKFLRSTASPGKAERLSDRDEIIAAVAHGGVGKIIFLLGFGLLLGGVNALLLSAFFREFFGTRSPVPTLLPELQIGHIAALVTFLIEISAGWGIHHYSHLPVETLSADSGDVWATRPRKGPEHVWYALSWGVVVGLCLFEAVAYGILSKRIGAAAALGIGPGSAFYGVSEYFLVIFGVCIAGGLAMVGYSLEDAIRRRLAAKIAREFVNALRRRDETIEATIERVRVSVERIGVALTTIPERVVESFQDRLQLSGSFPGAPIALYEGTTRVLASADPSSVTALTREGFRQPERPAIRTHSQVTADLLVYTLLSSVLVFAVVATTMQIVAWVRASQFNVPVVATFVIGLLIPTGAIAVGHLSWTALDRARYSTVVEQSMREPAGRRRLGYLSLALGVFIVILLAVLAGSLGFFVAHPLLSSMAGATFGAILVAMGGVVDRCLLALAYVGYLVALATVRVVSALLATAMIAIGALCSITIFVLRVLAVPGDVILRAVRGRPRRSAAATALS